MLSAMLELAGAISLALLALLGLAVAVARSRRRRPAAARSGRDRYRGARPGGVLVLVGAFGSRLRLNGSPLDTDGQDGTLEGVDVIFPGRHRIEADLGDGRSAVWDVALEQGEVLARRLDRARGEWAACEPPPGEGPPRLVAFARRSPRAADAAVREAREKVRALLRRVEAGEPLASAVAQGAKIGDALVGVPLEPAHFLELRGPFALAAREALGRRRAEEAKAIALAGLALLPEDAALLDVAAGALAASGDARGASDLGAAAAGRRRARPGAD